MDGRTLGERLHYGAVLWTRCAMLGFVGNGAATPRRPATPAYEDAEYTPDARRRRPYQNGWNGWFDWQPNDQNVDYK